MKKVFFVLVALIAANGVFAQDLVRTQSSITVTGYFYPDDQDTTVNEFRVDPELRLGFDSMFNFSGWKPLVSNFFQASIQLDNNVSTFRNPKLVSAIALPAFSGNTWNIGAVLNVPWAELSYKAPGVGIYGDVVIPTSGSSGFRLGASGWVHPGLWGENPGYAAAKAAKINAESKYMQWVVNPAVTFFWSGLFVSADASIRGDNWPYKDAKAANGYALYTNWSSKLSFGVQNGPSLFVGGGMTGFNPGVFVPTAGFTLKY